MPLTRRRFGRGLGASLALAALPRPVASHDGPHEVAVRIEDFAFVPATVEILEGDTVVWSNADLAPHTATQTKADWDSGLIETGAQARVTFDRPGAHDYLCAYHPHMTGRVIVRPKA